MTLKPSGIASASLSAFAVLIAMLIAFPATAVPIIRGGALLGTNEVPPNASPGFGNALVTLDGDLLSVHVVFANLTSNTVASHIHCCAPPGSNAIVATTVPTFANFPLGVTSG